MPISKIKTSSITADAASTNLNIDANTLFLDATNNRIGVNNTNPTVSLDVTGAAAISGTATLNTLVSSGATLTGGSINNMAVGATTPAAGSFTALTTSGTVTHNAGTANGVAFLNGSKVLTTGSALTFDGTDVGIGGAPITGLALRLLRTSGGASIRYQNTAATWDSGVTAAGAYEIFSAANTSIQFGINSSERVRIDSSGNVGIGTSSPATKVHALTASATAVAFRAGNSMSFAEFQVDASGNSQLVAPGGNQIFNTNGAERMRIDSSGNLGIGTSSPGQKLDVVGSVRSIGTTANVAVEVVNNAGSLSLNARADISAHLIDATVNPLHIRTIAAQPLVFATSGTERMRIESSGNLLVGATSTVNAGNGTNDGFTVFPIGIVGISTNNDRSLFLKRRSSDGNIAVFYRDNTLVGTISVTTTTTSYNSPSDYRLKTVIGPVANAGQRIDALQPVEYTWNASGERTRGFLAHQFAKVYAGSVSGTKDAVDVEGKPVYQAMQASTSEVIADLVAEIQSLRARVAQLESN